MNKKEELLCLKKKKIIIKGKLVFVVKTIGINNSKL